jgi:hypothetical protein|tara:strand:+ start:1573 stop:1794 length:222 start_codon:yes stop_codon:yes gene_type:complete
MLDQDTLRPVIVSMALYISIATLVPILFKKPTNVKFVDDITLSIIRQKEMLMSGTIIIGLITLGTNYINEELI